MAGLPPSPSARPPHAGRTRRWSVIVLALVLALTLAGCQKDAAKKKATALARQNSAKGLTVSGEWPLTGLAANGAAPSHPVMIVKIDNSANSSPQIGLSKADLVTEELVEGGSTRLAVFFYQHVPKLVGPVRSMRATDIGIVKPAKAVLVASGGAPPTVKRIKGAHIRAFTEGATGYERSSSRQAPYNLFMVLTRLAHTLHSTTALGSYLPFGPASNLPKGQKAGGLSAVFSGSHTTQWTYQAGHYVNQNSYAAAGDRFRPDNVLVLRVQVGNAGYFDPAGHTVPETKLHGTGKALLFHGGRVVRGTWRKSLTSTISLRSGGGALHVPAGHTWVELVPANGGRVLITK